MKIESVDVGSAARVFMVDEDAAYMRLSSSAMERRFGKGHGFIWYRATAIGLEAVQDKAIDRELERLYREWNKG